YHHCFLVDLPLFPTRRSSDLLHSICVFNVCVCVCSFQSCHLIAKAKQGLVLPVQLPPELYNFNPLENNSQPVVSKLPSVSPTPRSEEHTSELQSRFDIVCRLL